MANQKYLDLLESGVLKWNAFRYRNHGALIDLRGVRLSWSGPARPQILPASI